MSDFIYITALGEDSHTFSREAKPLVLAGVCLSETGGLAANSDGDLILHACCHAIASLAGIDPFLGPPADPLCAAGERDSVVYLERQWAEALAACPSLEILHVSVSIEAKRPKLYPHFQVMRQRLAEVLKLSASAVGITAHTGEGLSAVGRGEGMACRVLISARRRS